MNEDLIAAHQAARTATLSQARFLSILFLIIVPAAIGFVTNLVSSHPDSRLDWFFLVCLIVFQLAAFVWGGFRASEQVPDLYFAAMQRDRDLADSGRLVTALEGVLESSETALQITRVWSSVQTHAGLRLSAGEDVKSLIGEVAGQVIEQGKSIFGFDYDDRWSIVVYEWNPTTSLLEPIWYKREPRHLAEGHEPRKWRDGEGHCGTAFMSLSTIVTDDFSLSDVQNKVRPSPSNLRDYDAAAYGSFATAPIRVIDQGSTLRLGVVAITSDQKGRFSDANVGVVDQLADVLAGLLWSNAKAASGVGIATPPVVTSRKRGGRNGGSKTSRR